MSTANFLQIKYQGVNIPSQTTSVAATAGDIAYNSTVNKWDVYNTAADFLVTESTTQTLTNKTISASSNTISGITNASLSGSAGITNANLAAMAANTVKANITGSSATPTDAALGTVTEATSAVLTLTGWADATIGSPTIQVKQATTSTSGYLSSTDWNTFNNKATPGNYITALTGDVTASGPGSAAASLVATSNATLTTLSALTTASSLSSIGTITSGTWQGTAIGAQYGGTAINTSASTGVAQVASGTWSVSTIPLANTSYVSGTLAVANGGTGVTTASANTVFAGPTSGSAAAPSFRALDVADMTIAQQSVSASAIDWSTGNLFTKTLGANTTFTFSNALSGQTIVVRLTNTASNYTVTWPTVRWAGGTAPIMSTGAVSDVYTFIYDGSNYYGAVVQAMS